MKGKLLTTFFSLAILVGLSTNAFSQAVKVWFEEPVVDPISTAEVTTGTAVLIIEASQDTIDNGIQTPDVSNPYFLSNGDSVAQVTDVYYNPFAYFNYADYGMPFFPNGQTDITLDPTIYQTGGTFSFFVRIFNNLKGDGPAGVGLPASSFDSAGNFVGDPGLLAETRYFDTAIQTITIPPAPDRAYADFSIVLGDQNWMPLINSEPIPEPSAMFLMAAGLLWFGRKLKRK